MGTRSHFSPAQAEAALKLLRSWRHGAAWGPPSPLRQACQETPGAPTRKSHTTEHSGGLRKGVWMKGSGEGAPPSPTHPHAELRACAHSHTVHRCAGPVRGPRPPGTAPASQARPLRGKGELGCFRWTRRTLSPPTCPGGPGRGRVGVGRASPWPVRPCLPLCTLSQKSPSAWPAPWGEGGRRWPASAREQGFPETRAPRPWPSTGHRADPGGRAGWGWASCPHQPCQSLLPRAPPQGSSTSLWALPSVHGAWLEGCQAGAASFPLGPQAPGGHGNKG